MKKKKKKKQKRQDSVQSQETTIVIDDEQESNDPSRTPNTNTIVETDLLTKPQQPSEIVDRQTPNRQRQAKVLVDNTDNIERDATQIGDRHTGTTDTTRNFRNSITGNDTGAFDEPIVGYAAEPLLPLVKACAPLDNILHNLSHYVQLALHDTPEEPPNDLTIDESAAIRLYTIEWEEPYRSLYSMLNRTLKTGTRQDLRPYFKYLKLFMTALVKLPCEPPLTVWRGVTKNLSANFPPGTPVTWWSFSSCTTALTVLENNMYLGVTGDRTLFSVEAINARTISAHSYFTTEDEVLLLPGTHMTVQSQFSPAPELHIIHLKQVEPEEILLEPPFEGNVLLFVDDVIVIERSSYRCITVSEDQVSLV